MGNVTAALAQQKMMENVIILFTADNGGPTTTGDAVGSRNYPLKGGKHSICAPPPPTASALCCTHVDVLTSVCYFLLLLR